jgi:hypothetical protein
VTDDLEHLGSPVVVDRLERGRRDVLGSEPDAAALGLMVPLVTVSSSYVGPTLLPL